MVLELLEKETLSKDDMARICARVQKRPPMSPFNGFGKRAPSDKPPVMTPAEIAELQRKAADEATARLASTTNGYANGGGAHSAPDDDDATAVILNPGTDASSAAPGDPLTDPLPPPSDTLGGPQYPGQPGWPGTNNQ
jgi:cell division protease FtsH